MTLSYEQGITWLNSDPNATVTQLKNLVLQVSTNVDGAKTTVIYFY